ncbi:MAG TPA: alpha/beta hydrolase-fold protein [Gaiellaceae bacterium]|jgi:enterochelin esterase-like enzyme|nr:alpha/beta hydrolase-fold protein [Gaiellaceae bacterium]
MAMFAAIATALLLPGFAPAASGPAGGQVLEGTFPGTMRPGYVYLPPGFNAGERYPVVYLLHGMRGSPSEYIAATQLPTFADTEIATGRLRPFIAVMPAAGSTPDYNGEWAGPWERALVHRVLPWVDAHLPTQQTAAGRVIAGLSAGGFGAFDIGLRHPQLFGTVESWSGYFTPVHDGPFKNATRAVLAANDPTLLLVKQRAHLSKTRFFVSTGPAHSRWAPPSQTIDYAARLRALGLRYTLRIYPSKDGEWRDQLDDGLRWALGPLAHA